MSSITLISNLIPKNNGDFPILEDIYLKSGHRVVNTISDRNAITIERRNDGMKVAVVNDGTSHYNEYILRLGTIDSDLSNNGNWIAYTTIMGLGDTTSKVYNLIKPTENLIIHPNQEYYLKNNFYNKGTLTINTNGDDNFGSGMVISTDGIFICDGDFYDEGIIVNFGVLIM